jgi:hypothetical protein
MDYFWDQFKGNPDHHIVLTPMLEQPIVNLLRVQVVHDFITFVIKSVIVEQLFRLTFFLDSHSSNGSLLSNRLLFGYTGYFPTEIP